MRNLFIFIILILMLSVLTCGNGFSKEEHYVEQEFKGNREVIGEYNYIFTSTELGQPKKIKELKYFVVVELDRSDLEKIRQDYYNIRSYKKSDLNDSLPFLENVINSLQIDVYLKNTDKDIPEILQNAHEYYRFRSEKPELDLSGFRLISKGSLVQENIFNSGLYIYLETRVLFDGVFEYLSQDNLEIVAKLKANNDGKRNIYLETNCFEIENILKSTDRVVSSDEYYPNDDSKEEYYYPGKTQQNYNQSLNIFFNNYNNPVTGIKFTFMESYPHPPKLKHLENGSRIFSKSVTLKWDKNLYTESFDLYLHRDKEKVMSLNPNALIVSDLKTEEYSLNDLDNGASYYWLVLAKKNNSQHKTKSEVYSFLVDSNTDNKEENSTIVEISSLEKLREISSKPGYWDKSFILTRDIDASITVDWNDGAGFTPIGNDSLAFTGVFNGNNHKITNIYINRPKNSNVGFFGYLDSVLVKDLWIESATIRGLNNIGILAGVNDNNSEIINCHTSGEILCDYIYGDNLAIYEEFKKNPHKEIIFTMNSGGLVGVNKNSSIIKLSSSSAMVEGNKIVGGLVGENSSGSKIFESFSTGDVFGYKTVGGLVAQNIRYVPENNFRKPVVSRRIVSNITQELEVYNPMSKKEQDTLKTEIIKCYSSGSVSGDLDYACDASFVSNSFNTHFGDFADKTWVIGGLVGLNSSYIIDSYTLGSVTGNLEIGVLFGVDSSKDDSYRRSFRNIKQNENEEKSKIINSYYNYEKSYLNGNKLTSSYSLPDKVFKSWQKNNYVLTEEKYSPSSQLQSINSVEDLESLNLNTKKSKINYELKTDLDLSDYPNFYILQLYGNFEGNGHTIKNLNLDIPSAKHLGLFGEIIGGSVTNLVLENAYLKGNGIIGGLAGEVRDSSSIKNITIRATIENGKDIGGLAGIVNDSELTNCVAELQIKGDEPWLSSSNDDLYAGGLVGKCSNTTINFSSTNVDFMEDRSQSRIGGLVGSASSSIISESYTNALISRGCTKAGFIATINDTNIKNCYSKSIIDGFWYQAGFVYSAEKSNITNCYSTSFVYDSDYRKMSSFIRQDDETEISNSFFAIELEEELKNFDNAKYYADLRIEKTFTKVGWDFKNIWEINMNKNSGYPTLKHVSNNFSSLYYKLAISEKEALFAKDKNDRSFHDLENDVRGRFYEFKAKVGDSFNKDSDKLNQLNIVND